jgi:hypothetical protein
MDDITKKWVDGLNKGYSIIDEQENKVTMSMSDLKRKIENGELKITLLDVSRDKSLLALYKYQQSLNKGK